MSFFPLKLLTFSGFGYYSFGKVRKPDDNRLTVTKEASELWLTTSKASTDNGKGKKGDS